MRINRSQSEKFATGGARFVSRKKKKSTDRNLVGELTGRVSRNSAIVEEQRVSLEVSRKVVTKGGGLINGEGGEECGAGDGGHFHSHRCMTDWRTRSSLFERVSERGQSGEEGGKRER